MEEVEDVALDPEISPQPSHEAASPSLWSSNPASLVLELQQIFNETLLVAGNLYFNLFNTWYVQYFIETKSDIYHIIFIGEERGLLTHARRMAQQMLASVQQMKAAQPNIECHPCSEFQPLDNGFGN